MRSTPLGFGSSEGAGGGAKRTKKLRKLEQIAKIKKLLKSHNRTTPVNGEDAPNFLEINWGKQYTNFESYQKMWKDAWNGNFQYGVRLVNNRLVRNGARDSGEFCGLWLD